MSRHGPTYAVACWDPSRADVLLGRLDRAVAEAPSWLSAHLTTEPGAPGCGQLVAWLGDLDLGDPDGPAERWDRFREAVRAVVLRVRPALALEAPTWGLGDLLDPRQDDLGPGLARGWVRLDGLGAVRRARFAVLEDRGTVRPQADGLAWDRGDQDDGGAGVADAVFWAWAGETGPQAARSTRVLLTVPDAVADAHVAAALPDGYEVLGVAGGRAVARPPAWADPVEVREVDLPRAVALLGATSGRVTEWVRGGRTTTAEVGESPEGP